MNFFKISLKNLKETGTIAASSKKYSKLITDSANLSSKKCVVELGPGDGVITKEIIKQISSKTKFFCLEINKQFVVETEKNCPKAKVYHASALEIKKYLNKHDESTCNCIISGLPWALFEQEKQEEIIDEVYKSLENGGQFLTIAYITGIFFPSGIRFKKLLKKKFSDVKKTKIIWSNFLPAFAYICTK
jgi:phospholipid N-methyltransferase